MGNENIINFVSNKYGIYADFSSGTLNEINKIPDYVLDKERIGRDDYTDKVTFTIDSKYTKDIDDAISIELLDNGNYLLGVHIADVSHYVPFNSSIDFDAYEKGRSIYFGNSVIPMLPIKLSNGICSLNPNVDRLSLSCMMELSRNGKVVNSNIRKSVINSNKKMNYDEVNNILDNKEYDCSYNDYVSDLKILYKISLLLKKSRLLNGSLDFDKDEIRFIFDNDSVTDIDVRRNKKAESIIEECMILANEEVCKYLYNTLGICLNRVHGKPNLDKMDDFVLLMNSIEDNRLPYNAFDYCENKNALKDLFSYINNSKYRNIFSNKFITCLGRAYYSEKNSGHYGLAKNYYCHYTSPIRRYSDLTVHRLLYESLDNKNYGLNIPEIAIQTTKTEFKAKNIERKMNKYYEIEYLNNNRDNDYIGSISLLNESKMFVVLDNLIDGVVDVKDIDDEFVFDGDHYSLISINGGDNYNIGDRLSLKVKSANKRDLSIKFKIVNKLSSYKNKSYNDKKINLR